MIKTTATVTDFPNLPADIATAIADYDAKVKTGQIHFDSEGFATGYDGQAESEASLMAFVGSKIPGI